MKMERRRLLKVGLLGGIGTILAPASVLAQPRHRQVFNVVPITITEILVTATGLVAKGLIGNTPFQVPLLLSSTPGGVCPILNLELGPIDLNLLGLRVQTSEICVRVQAERGALLGDLLCAIANLLNGPNPLANLLAFLNGLNAGQLGTLLAGLLALLNGALAPVTSSQANLSVSGSAQAAAGARVQTVQAACDILNLSLGPIDLNILGLDVEVDDCDGGPVTVDVTAEEGPGNLLGNLLCGLTGALDGGISLGQIINRVNGLLNRGA